MNKEKAVIIKLKDLLSIKNLDIPALGKHDALNDAIMTSMMFLKLKLLNIQAKLITRIRKIITI